MGNSRKATTGLNRFLRTILAGLVATVVTAAGAITAAPQAAAATPVTSCSGVWMVVDFGTLGGGTQTRCATKYGTGTAALRSAGFTVTKDGGMITKLNKKPATVSSKGYWSYWHATKKSDGTFAAWSYSTKGADGYQPAKGSAEGWRYLSLSGARKTPSVKPPRGYAKAPTPTISGTATVGKTLTAKPGSWSPTPKLSYQWYRSGTKIAGATKKTFKLTSKDAGKRLTVKVTAKGSGLQTVSKTSAKTAKVKK